MFIILPTLIISITDVNAASKLTLDEFDSENDSIDIETEDQETSDDTSSESSSDIQSEDFTDVETEKSAETTSDFMSNTSTTSPAPYLLLLTLSLISYIKTKHQIKLKNKLTQC